MKLQRLGVSVAALALAFTAGCANDSGGAASESSDLTRANFASEVSQAQARAQTAHVEAKVNAQGQQMSIAGDMDMSQKDLAFDLTMSGKAMGGSGARFILVDRVIYLKMPGLTQSDKYIKIDASKANDPLAKMFNQILSKLNPSQAFEAFDAITKVERVGTQEVDGVQTTAYKVTVDTAKALKAQGMAGQIPTGQLPKTLTYDVWVDSANLVRRLRMDIPAPGGGAASAGTVDMTMSQWGEPVDIAAPPPGQTTTMGDMMNQMGSPARS